MRILSLSVFLLYAAVAQATEVNFSSGPRQTTLVELYTSEGCSSCPPAERWFSGLKKDPRLWREIVPVAYYVDYWNYMGWRDPYSSKRWSARQRDYKKSGAISSVYTPGFVINGEEWMGWFGPKIIPTSTREGGVLQVRVRDNQVMARFKPAQKQAGEWVLHVATLGFGIKSEISAGENAGKELTHDFMVLNQVDAKSASGRWRLTLPPVTQPSVKKFGLAAWVTRAGDMTPVQVVGGWLR